MYSEAQHIQNQPVDSKNENINLIRQINLTLYLSIYSLYPGIWTWVGDTHICIIDGETALQYDHDTAEGPIKIVLLYNCTQVTNTEVSPTRDGNAQKEWRHLDSLWNLCINLLSRSWFRSTVSTGKFNISLIPTTLLQQPQLLPNNLVPPYYSQNQTNIILTNYWN